MNYLNIEMQQTIIVAVAVINVGGNDDDRYWCLTALQSRRLEGMKRHRRT